MYPVLSGTYFDGQSSKPYIATIELRDHSIYVQVEDDFEKSKSINFSDLENIDFSSLGVAHLKFGDFPHQTLMIENKTDVNLLKEKLPTPQSISGKIYSKVLSGSALKTVFYSSILMIGVFFLYVQFVAPFIADKAVNLLPKSMEVTIGQKMSEPIFATLDIDEEKSKILTNFFEEVGFESEYPLELSVIDEPIINAFAVPGGKIVIYQGLLDVFDSWEQLAAVLSHELAHVELRHSMKQISRSLSTYLLFSIMTSDVNGISSVLIDNALMVKDLSNSRGMEKEADIIGLEYLLELNVDPQGMVGLFEALQEENDLGEQFDKVMKILSTHPLNQDRIDYLDNKIQALPTTEYLENQKLEEYFAALKE